MQHPLDRLGIVENEFCQKCKKDKGFCPHKTREVAPVQKDVYQCPVTSGAEYGWRPPIDNTNFGYGVKQYLPAFTQDFRSSGKPKEEKDNKK